MSRAMVHRFLLLFAVVFLAGQAVANPVRNQHTTVELISREASAADGGVVRLGIVMTPQQDWHTYWKNYGDTGMENTATWTLPDGASAGPLIYPAPSRIPFGQDLMNYGYKGAATLLVDIQLPKGLDGAQPIKLALDYLVCDDEQCVPESAELSLTVPVLPTAAADPARAAQFAAAEAALPQKVDWAARYAVQGETLIIAVPWASQAAPKTAYFYPDAGDAISHVTAQQIQLRDGQLWVVTKPGFKTDYKDLTGVLEVQMEGAPAPEYFAISAAQTPKLAAPSASPQAAGVSIPLAIGYALIAGLILNLMPCVFPILSLKALSVVQGHGGGAPRQEALAYTGGVLATFAIVGGALMALRASGVIADWGYQMQDPRFVLAIALVMVVIGLNLAGLFEIGGRFAGAGQGLAQKTGTWGAFWTGALAVVVATPCTAPFMGQAIFTALAVPVWAGLLVFLGLGLGMALPFLALGFAPGIARILPKPGAWMNTFKQFLAFPMLATAIWLFWILGGLASNDAVALGLIAALLIGLALWLTGRWQANAGKGWLAGAAVVTAVVLSIAIGGRLSAEPSSPGTTKNAANALSPQAFSTAELTKLVAAGTPTFVYFTADWCITCKANERAAFTTEVADAFKQAGVTVLEGDFTRRDAEIAKTLNQHGRSGVPLYLYYPKGAALTQPQILPQILTPGTLTALVNS
jgi:thiol:disulfide interchange protein